MKRLLQLVKNQKNIIVIFALVFLNKAEAQTIHILFDATKAEMAGNADWVIDADQTNVKFGPNAYTVSGSGFQSNPQITPTPAQSGISSTTAETYWTGALSSWAVDCVNKGYVVTTLPYNGHITYGDVTNAQDLTHYEIFVIDEPNMQFTATEKTAIVKFVQNGGGLFMIADHNVSDRNSDGWDSPHVWNDLLSTNSIQAYPFGFYFDTVDFSQTTTNISATATDSIIHGTAGNVTKVQWAGGTTMTLQPTLNSTVKGVVYKTGTTPGNTNCMVAYSRFGLGKVVTMGDSSPADDSTGNPTCTLYNGYWTDAAGNHRKLIMNMTIWLATRTGSNSVSDVVDQNEEISIYPNPAQGTTNLLALQDMENTTVNILNTTGSIVYSKNNLKLNKDEKLSIELLPGFYIVHINNGKSSVSRKILVY